MKKFGKRIVGLVAMMALVSCAFVGATFAKYTSAKESTATTDIALWQVNGVSENGTVQTFTLANIEEFQPNADGTASTIATVVYVVSNASDVDATISISQDAFVATWVDGTDKLSGKSEQIADVFSIEYFYKVFDNATSVAAEQCTTAWTNQTLEKETSATKVLGIVAKITWRAASNDTAKDEVDTLIGMYLTGLSIDITVTATQAS